ncbi:MAG: hypothetical protein AAB371_00710 [Patescibacteria group bacterium]
MGKNSLIRKIYLYIFSAIGLVILIIGIVNLINLGLRMFIFKNADYIYSSYTPAPMPVEKIGTSTSDRILENSIEVSKKNQQMEINRSRERDAANALAMIIVGLPVYLYHWRIINKDREKELEVIS